MGVTRVHEKVAGGLPELKDTKRRCIFIEGRFLKRRENRGTSEEGPVRKKNCYLETESKGEDGAEYMGESLTRKDKNLTKLTVNGGKECDNQK